MVAVTMNHSSHATQALFCVTTQLTGQQVRAIFDEQGISIADFARTHQLNCNTVYQLLDGAKKGKRGESHHAAVLLGLKKGTYPPAPEIQAALTQLNND